MLSARSSPGNDTQPSSFHASFLVPFERNDIYKEVVKANSPLGIDTKRVNINVTMGGVPVDAVRVGCIREAVFVDNSGQRRPS